ncbi:MAG: DUF1549 domain-containing protein, partial [Chthonomonadales bacterium]
MQSSPINMIRIGLVAATGAACLLSASTTISHADSADAERMFRQRILPILRENCFSCHGPLKISGLDMRTSKGLRSGGLHGVDLIPGTPEKSRLFRFVSGLDKTQMPPGKRLSPADVATLRTWIAGGALWPASVDASHELPFAFRAPQRSVVPAVRSKAWVLNPIDAFVLSKLEKQGLKPAPPADPITLLRRVTFDLTGLPPTPADVDNFLKDRSPDAYEKVVDRLLASTAY